MKKRAQAWFKELRGKLIDMIENHDTGSFIEKNGITLVKVEA